MASRRSNRPEAAGTPSRPPSILSGQRTDMDQTPQSAIDPIGSSSGKPTLDLREEQSTIRILLGPL